MEKNLVKLLAFTSFVFFQLGAYAQVVNENNYASSGWEKNPNPTTPNVNFVCGPSNPPIGKGSLELITVAQTERVRFRTNQRDSTFLKDITELKYSTYIISGSNSNAPILTLQIDIDGTDSDSDGKLENDFNINFVPKTAGSVNLNEWQEWDALNGIWSFFAPKLDSFVNPLTGVVISDLSTLRDNSYSLAVILQTDEYKDARIMNTSSIGAPGGGGIRFTAGGGMITPEVPDEWANFQGSIDAFKISSNGKDPLYYDFEPSFTIRLKQTFCVNNPGFLGFAWKNPNSIYDWSWSNNLPPLKQNIIVQKKNSFILITAKKSTKLSGPIIFILTETTSGGCVFKTIIEVEVVEGVCDKSQPTFGDWLKGILPYSPLIIIIFITGLFVGRRWIRKADRADQN